MQVIEGTVVREVAFRREMSVGYYRVYDRDGRNGIMFLNKYKTWSRIDGDSIMVRHPITVARKL